MAATKKAKVPQTGLGRLRKQLERRMSKAFFPWERLKEAIWSRGDYTEGEFNGLLENIDRLRADLQHMKLSIEVFQERGTV